MGKRIFISDIHMGDARSMQNQNHYGWFVNNVPILTQFLDDQLNDQSVSAVVIVGDLFDQWVIPTDLDPLLSFDAICSNPTNVPVINKLKVLAASADKRLCYLPGNHDMSMSLVGMPAVRDFLQGMFPGIQFLCEDAVPLGTYTAGNLVAEHGDRYCLFNAPDTWTAADTFLPAGYFIARMVAYKVSQTGSQQNYFDILHYMLHQFADFSDAVLETLFLSVAEDCGLSANDAFALHGVPGFNGSLTVGEAGKRFKDLVRQWRDTAGHINTLLAIESDIGKMRFAAMDAYHLETTSRIVIFGHTHQADFMPLFAEEPGHGTDRSNVPCRSIYANSGAWVDMDKDHTCTYVETEEDAAAGRHYVRLKNYPKNEYLDSAFVSM